jgi:hypothetical protein
VELANEERILVALELFEESVGDVLGGVGGSEVPEEVL